MKKSYILLCFAMSVLTITVSAQAEDPNVFTTEGRATKRHFKPANPATDKTDMFDISAIGATTFTTSNTSDGSPNSYKHSQRITVALQAAGKTNVVQLVFYSANAEMPYAAAEERGMVSVYFPISMYTEIRGKMETALAARKKVQVKVMQGKDGFREGTLVL